MPHLDIFNKRSGPIDESLFGVLDRIGLASVLIGRRGQLVHMNRAAFMLIYDGQGDVLQLRGDPFTTRTAQNMLAEMFGVAELDLPGRFRRLAFRR